MAHAGVTSRTLRRMRRERSPRTISVQPAWKSCTEDPSPPTDTEAAQGWLNCPSQLSHFRRMQSCETCLVVLKHGGRHGSSSQEAYRTVSAADPASRVRARTGLSKTTIWRQIRNGDFRSRSNDAAAPSVGWRRKSTTGLTPGSKRAMRSIRQFQHAIPFVQTLPPYMIATVARFARSSLLQGGRREV